MQDTLKEHAGSSRAAAPCQSCHMPLVDGPGGKHRSHAFTVLKIRRCFAARSPPKPSATEAPCGSPCVPETWATPFRRATCSGDLGSERR